MRVVDCMPVRDQSVDLVRVVEGVRGRVPMHMDFVVRFDYGSVVPWVRAEDGHHPHHRRARRRCASTHAGAARRAQDFRHAAEFTVERGRPVPFVLAWHPSHEQPPPRGRRRRGDRATRRRSGGEWSAPSRPTTATGPTRCSGRSSRSRRSPTRRPAGSSPRPTTSLPERIGGVRNWDYRYCWLRDATFTLYALMSAGYTDEALAWRDWLLRAVAGDPAHLQIMYGAGGRAPADEYELDWLAGLRGLGAGAGRQRGARQFQLDVYGEVLDALHQARLMGIERGPATRGRCSARSSSSSSRRWREPDEGIWEVRGGRRALHALEGDGLGRVRPGGEGRRAVRARRAGRPLARVPRRDPRRGAASGASTPSATPSRSLRLARARRERC